MRYQTLKALKYYKPELEMFFLGNEEELISTYGEEG